MRIALLGDVHRNHVWLRDVLVQVKGLGVEKVVALGDFGYTFDPEFRQRVQDLVDESGIEVYWMDGNHDNHAYIRENFHDGEFNEIGPGFFFIPRGHSWEWEGVRFLAVGGAYSIDKKDRLLGAADSPPQGGWHWEDEELSLVQFNQIMNRDYGRIRLMLTHDAPYGVPTIEREAQVIPASVPHRHALRAIVDKKDPAKVFHGHWHYGYEDKLENTYRTPVCGLGADPTMNRGKVDWSAVRILRLEDRVWVDEGFFKRYS
jgi:predicted phosphodiesterase